MSNFLHNYRNHQHHHLKLSTCRTNVLAGRCLEGLRREHPSGYDIRRINNLVPNFHPLTLILYFRNQSIVFVFRHINFGLKLDKQNLSFIILLFDIPYFALRKIREIEIHHPCTGWMRDDDIFNNGLRSVVSIVIGGLWLGYQDYVYHCFP